MFIRERETTGRTDVNYYTARRLGDMADSLGQLARAFDGGGERAGQLTRRDGMAAMQAGAALVCGGCSDAACMRTANGRIAIIFIIFSEPLSRREGSNVGTCPGCSRKAAAEGRSM